MPTSKNSTLSNLEDNLFSMSEKESSLLSEAMMTQTDVDCQLNDESLNTFEATTGDGAIDSVTLDDNGGASSSLKRRRGKDKAASPERRPKEVSNKPGKAADKTKTKEGAKHASQPSNTSKTNKTVRSEKGGKTTASTSSAADAADITQLSNILQSSLSSAFAGLTASLKTGFADLGKLIQDSKRPEAQESGSESGDEDSDKNESDEPPAKRQKAADSSPAIIEKLTKDLALEDEKGPDINVQLAGLVHKLLREAKPNETKLNELKKQYIPPNNCEGLSETRVNANIWNNLGETARSNDLKSASTIGPGRRGTSYLTDFDETWPV